MKLSPKLRRLTKPVVQEFFFGGGSVRPEVKLRDLVVLGFRA